jgi:hypothetical protein
LLYGVQQDESICLDSKEAKMKVNAFFVKDVEWWVAWTDDVPGAMTQGRTLQEARENLIDAIQEIQKPVDLSQVPQREIVTEIIEI